MTEPGIAAAGASAPATGPAGAAAPSSGSGSGTVAPHRGSGAVAPHRGSGAVAPHRGSGAVAPRGGSGAVALWALLTLREWRHHPWRHGAAMLAVALGVALAYSVHLINTSALGEFAQAVRGAQGEPDLSLRGARFDDALFERVVRDPAVARASPVLELDTYAFAADGRRVAVRVLGIDALLAAPMAPALWPQPAAGADRLAFLDPDAAFVNAAARQLLGDGALALQAGPARVALRVAGSVAVPGPALVVMDLAGAQHHFDADGRLSRIDVQLVPGHDARTLAARLALPPGVTVADADAGEQRVSQLSRAYRVNLTVLALVALFVGAFLVFSVVSLSVAQRSASFALLGVLGMSARQRRAGVLGECAALGLVGSAVGLALGAAMAAVALRLLSGDLGGGYFPGIAPRLQLGAAAALAFGALGVASAVAGGWWPARQARALVPAQALKGLGGEVGAPPRAWPGVALLLVGALAALLPPLGGLPLAAYASVAALLLGGVALVPAAVQALLRSLGAGADGDGDGARDDRRGPLALLALRRAHRQRHAATAAVAGVVASLALSVALTVMVASFRGGVADWLGDVLPADLYARSAGSGAAAEQAWLPPSFVERARAVPGVARLQASRVRSLSLAPGQPAVTLLARPLPEPARDLPLLAPPRPPTTVPGEVDVFVSEAVVSLYGAAPGTRLVLPLDGGAALVGRVRGVWRDYARQFGAVVVADADYRRLTGDARVNDLALWLAPGADAAAVQAALRAAAGDPSLLEFASVAELRTVSLRIFDRSFAVTYYLQAVAIGIGLVGIAASLSAQVLARRKEFGLLSHLGLTRRQIVAVVAAEGAAWVAGGTLVGLLLGMAISLVLVWVVNPQSFHWTMAVVWPAGRLALLCAAVLVAGTVTAALSARGATARQAVLSVKEDW